MRWGAESLKRVVRRPTSRRQIVVVAAVLLALAPIGAKAQFGPLQARGYIEYQYLRRQMAGGRSYDTHAASLRTGGFESSEVVLPVVSLVCTQLV